MSDPCTQSIQEYINFYEKSKGTNCDLDNYWKNEIRADYCSNCLPQYDKLLSNYMSLCSSGIDPSLKLNYDGIQFYKSYYCAKDSSNGKYCNEVAQEDHVTAFNYKIPYSSWNSDLCKSSCVETIDKAIRVASSNNDLMTNYQIDASLFTGSSNPVSSCGSNGGSGAGSAQNGSSIGSTGTGTGASSTSKTGFTTGSKFDTSGANSLSAQVCLLSLIICFILALLK